MGKASQWAAHKAQEKGILEKPEISGPQNRRNDDNLRRIFPPSFTRKNPVRPLKNHYRKRYAFPWTRKTAGTRSTVKASPFHVSLWSKFPFKSKTLYTEPTANPSREKVRGAIWRSPTEKKTRGCGTAVNEPSQVPKEPIFVNLKFPVAPEFPKKRSCTAPTSSRHSSIVSNGLNIESYHENFLHGIFTTESESDAATDTNKSNVNGLSLRNRIPTSDVAEYSRHNPFHAETSTPC